ncbi:unnamed protein product [Blepharisma stoltei]|uniref:RING-type domain-containing protein n=1 Tax=Blepharisma stoltei TaxID=1481888 RepID=A0AAU9JZT0_9CILI|nr:unnamed protein product [Blepharisma stoltei]
MDERSPLNISQEQNSSLSQQTVRENLYIQIQKALYCSYILLLIRLIIASAKISFSSFVISSFETSCDEPLFEWVYFSMILDIIYLILSMCRIPYIKRARDGEEIIENHYLQVSFKSHALIYTFWLIPGNAWFWSCNNCQNEAPELTELTFILIVLGYMYLMIPTLIIISVCACLPIAILLLIFLSPSEDFQTSRRIIKELDWVEYDYEVHHGDVVCPICAFEYMNKEKIVVLECDSRHFFHSECIRKWLTINLSCPICRAPVLLD